MNPQSATEADPRPRTLTELYNGEPGWLKIRHATLDRAVLAACALAESAGRDQILAHLLDLHNSRAAAAPAMAEAEIEVRVSVSA